MKIDKNGVILKVIAIKNLKHNKHVDLIILKKLSKGTMNNLKDSKRL
jgi:hypothetical protein